MSNNNLDISNLRQVILDSISQVNYTYTIANPENIQKTFDNIIINGMGGSALPAELLSETLFQFVEDETQYPIHIHRGYGLSRHIKETSLILSISYSGNTEETLSAYNAAIEKGYTVIALAAGGALISRAQELDKPYIIIPNPDPQFQPRYATLYLLKAIIEVLIQYGIATDDIRQKLIEYVQEINAQEFEKQGQALANIIKGKTPIIYATQEYKLVAHLWKIKINENAKTPAFWNYIPELNHNEMVGFTNPQANFQFVFIHNEVEKSRNILRFQKLQQLLEGRGLSIQDILVPDFGNHLANLVAMTLIGDWTAYYLALAYGIDPTPVDMVEEFKILIQ
jgi:glucose/mannose-6-phosphate isomerase